ncbi:hypothetical protein [Streptosporangium roseum]|uniref:hypothetical protein n=1 Tax=Streptosporangium roseum TaxID=2001 RepID=UPI0004CCA821|nr:hypothetical protein [Streptosporangium roseum]
MNDLEERLRAALDARAGTYTAAPDAWPRVQARGRRVRRRRWIALVPVAAASTAVVLAMNLGGDSGGDGIATGVVDEPRDIYEQVSVKNPPVGEPVTIDDAPGEQQTRVWFTEKTAADGSTFHAFCQVTQDLYGGGMGGCGQEPDPRSSGAQAWYEGGTASNWPRPRIALSYGAARDGVAKAEAVTKDGARIPGTVHRPEGAPLAVWTVAFPSKAGVIRFEFSDVRGKVVQRVKLEVFPEDTHAAEPIGPGQDMPGGLTARLYANPDRTVVWSHGDEEVGLSLLESRLLLTDVAGKKLPVELQIRHGFWFGISRPGTARVSVVFKDGTSTSADTVPDPWGGTAVLFSGTYPPSGASPGRPAGDPRAEGYQIVGYDAAGAETWREDRPGRRPAWQTSPPGPSQPAPGQTR